MDLLPEKWSGLLKNQPESGMGYQICKATISDGRTFDVAIIECRIVGMVRGYTGIPFQLGEISNLEVIPDWRLRLEAHSWWTVRS